MFVEELNNEEEWEAFLQASQAGTFYHSLKWKEAIQKSFHHSPLYLTIKDAKGNLVGICPGFIRGSRHMRAYHSTPYSDYGGPVIVDNCVKEATVSLRTYLQNQSSREKITYAKFNLVENKSAQFLKSSTCQVEKAIGIIKINLKTTPTEFIWNKLFSGSRRRKLRLAERKGFEAWEAQTRSDLKDFYDLYSENMSHIDAPSYPYEFMENLWNLLHPKNLRLWVAGKNTKAASVLFFKHETGSYAAYAGIDRSKRVHGLVNYLWWEELKKAEEEGLRQVCLGSTPSDPRNPYYIQKTSFGGSFHQQETVWFPLNSTGRILLELSSTWKNSRKILPPMLEKNVRLAESKFGRF